MAYRADDPAPLLPASVRHRLQGWLWKMLGFLVFVACAALSASLLTWSAADPSLTRATSGAARNLLGPPGAILSDMLIQMLGLAGVFVLLPPLFWALQLLTCEQPPGLRGKLVLAPLAVLFLAGALSSLPSASSWPLHHGYGGMLGDLGLGLLASLLAHVNADRSSAAAGLFYFAAGLMVLMSSLGLTREELRLICQTNAQPNLRAAAGWCSRAATTGCLRTEPRCLRARHPIPYASRRCCTSSGDLCSPSPTWRRRLTSAKMCRARAATPRSIA